MTKAVHDVDPIFRIKSNKLKNLINVMFYTYVYKFSIYTYVFIRILKKKPLNQKNLKKLVDITFQRIILIKT